MVITGIYYFFFFYFRMSNVVNQRPADPTTTSGVNKAILWSGVKSIFPIYKFRVEYYITLLTLCLQIR